MELTDTQTAQVKHYRSQIAQIEALFAHIAKREEIPSSLRLATKSAEKLGYVTYDKSASRYVFTPKGTKFYRAMKKFSPAIAKASK